MSVEECGFTRCGETPERTTVLSFGPDEVQISAESSQERFVLTCGETHCNNHFGLAGGERRRRWIVKSCGAVQLPLQREQE